MKKKVVLAGLNSIKNYGDQFIGECVEYLIQKDNTEIECIHLDLAYQKRNCRFLIYGVLVLIARKIINKNIADKLRYIAMKILYYKNYFRILQSADALIFACGSFKYGTQKLWAQYSIAVECADRLNIPVMFDAMNIQKFDENSWKCLCLKEHANHLCVKMITTRDGYAGVERLKKEYITNKNIRIYPAGDPAFWIPECYMVHKQSKEIIGINLIREDIYKDYKWKNVSETELLLAYCELINTLNKEGIKWELFTNGLPEDYRFGFKIIENLGSENIQNKIVVPRDTKDLARIIAKYRGILGARLHASICAYSLGVPVAGFVWDEKILHFAEMAGIERFFWKKGEFNGEVLYRNLQKVLKSNIDQENRNKWKIDTQKTINEFLQMI